MDLKTINILELLPQRPPFIMVDKLLYFDEVRTNTCLTVRADNIFVDDDTMTAAGLIENIAQTCAVRLGYINRYIYKKDIKIGFIGAIKNLKIYRFPKLGEELFTSIVVEEEIFQMTLVNAEIKMGDDTSVSAVMKIAMSDMDVQI